MPSEDEDESERMLSGLWKRSLLTKALPVCQSRPKPPATDPALQFGFRTAKWVVKR